MYSLTPKLVLGLALLLVSLTGAAQTYRVNLAAIDVNVTLDADCAHDIIASQVLQGDFDVDGDGDAAPDSLFTIVVQDLDPSNGAQVDGCGSWPYTVTADAAVLNFVVTWGTVHAEDKDGPAIVSLPTAPTGPFFCDEIDDFNLNLLPATVSRCYQALTSSGNPLPGTLDPALEARLTLGGGLPRVFDNCSQTVEVCVTDIIIPDPNDPTCGDVILRRNFVVSDNPCVVNNAHVVNQTVAASYEITFTRPTLDDLNLAGVPATVDIECTDLPGLGLAFGDLPDPRPQDLPTLTFSDGTTRSIAPGPGGGFCGLDITFVDGPPIFTCPLQYKVIRTYTLIDHCDPTDVRTLTQVIKVGDTTPPTFTPPFQDLNFDGIPDVGPYRVTTNVGGTCEAIFQLDDSTIGLTDACSNDLTLSVSIQDGNDPNRTLFGSYVLDFTNGVPEFSDPLPLGNYVLRYTYVDDCGNRGVTDMDLVVEDGDAPAVVCEDGLNVSISFATNPNGGSLGMAVLTPAMIDNGTVDFCAATADLTFEIGLVRVNPNGSHQLIQNASYEDELLLTCNDLGVIAVGLRVTDPAGNENFCWTEVTVEDISAPSCQAPDNRSFTCDDYTGMGLPSDPGTLNDAQLDAAFGTAFGLDNCNLVISQLITGTVNNCGAGTLTRTFTTTDASGITNVNPCVQTITVSSVPNYTLELPGDRRADCDFQAATTDVAVTNGNCDMITVDVSTDRASGTGPACYDLLVTYQVINLCEYDPNADLIDVPRDFDGDNDLAESTFLRVDPGVRNRSDDDAAILDGDATAGNPGFTAPLVSGYGTAAGRGGFRYVRRVSISDRVDPTVTLTDPTDCFAADGASCTAEVTLDYSLDDNCTLAAEVTTTVELDADYDAAAGFRRTRFLLASEVVPTGGGNYTISVANVPSGDHALRIRAEDECGNVVTRLVPFCVSADVVAQPICHTQISIVLVPDGTGNATAAIWANDFIASGPTSSCGGNLKYSIYTETEANDPGFIPNPDRDGLVLDCNDPSTEIVRIYAFDPALNNAFCTVLLNVQNAADACDNGVFGNISGLVLSELGDPIGGVDMLLDGATAGGALLGRTTDASGGFTFDDLALGGDYTIDAFLDDYRDHNHGVSTFDLVLITRYILGFNGGFSNYQLLAADANNDENVTVQDIIAIRRLILGIDDEYPSNDAYRFVNADFIFPVTGNPWATSFPEVVNVNNLAGNYLSADFIGVMVGDVSGDGFSNNLTTGGGTRPRSAVNGLRVEDRLLEAGTTTEVALFAGGLQTSAGLQGTLTVRDGATLEGVSPALLTKRNYNADYLTAGVLPFSHEHLAGVEDGEVLMRLRVRADRTVRLSEVLRLTGDVVAAEVYVTDRVRTPTLFFDNVPTETKNELRVAPNPFDEMTRLSVRSDRAREATLTVHDMTGRIVLSHRLELPKGQWEIGLRADEIGLSGVYMLAVTGKDLRMSRKIVIR